MLPFPVCLEQNGEVSDGDADIDGKNQVCMALSCKAFFLTK
jgi:hypothetical protein